ncbi:MAG: N,N-dimethylformamidase beta subunit family domain-containing protein [Gaiellaceae bacterium]
MARRSISVSGAAACSAVLVLLGASPPTPRERAPEGRAPTRAELRPSIAAAFREESYRPGDAAKLVITNRASGIVLQLFRSGPERIVTRNGTTMHGVPVAAKVTIGASRGRRVVEVRIGDWPSGLYFARLVAADGRVGFAPFVVRPRRLGEHRVAVVLPTLTWQAYNLRDENGDGVGDSWYASWQTKTVRLGRPYLSRGVPYNFHRYDLPFLRWLAKTGKQVDVLAQSDLAAVPSARSLAKAYELVVFPGHHEYVTTREYDLVERYRDLGGNLVFLSANNFFWRVVLHGDRMTKTELWRKLGRSEAALIGVQYLVNGRAPRQPWIVRGTPAASWVFAGTGLREGSRLGRGGVEIDHTVRASPSGVQVLAEIPNLFGPGHTAQMSYYETRAGAKVFAAGAFYLTRLLPRDRPVSRLLENLWARLSAD